MKSLEILWQRLVDETGQTCDRCKATETALEDAAQKLRHSLEPLGVEVVIKKESLTKSAFLKDPLESNRIWMAGKPLENWLSATTGQSRCCAPCGDSECRTLTVDGETYEAVPSELLVKAGLIAATGLIGGECGNFSPPAQSAKNRSECCPASPQRPGST